MGIWQYCSSCKLYIFMVLRNTLWEATVERVPGFSRYYSFPSWFLIWIGKEHFWWFYPHPRGREIMVFTLYNLIFLVSQHRVFIFYYFIISFFTMHWASMSEVYIFTWSHICFCFYCLIQSSKQHICLLDLHHCFMCQNSVICMMM